MSSEVANWGGELIEANELRGGELVWRAEASELRADERAWIGFENQEAGGVFRPLCL